MITRVILEMILLLLMRIIATIIPSGRENRSVRKKMAQVFVMPSAISLIIVNSVMEIPLSLRT